LAKTGMFDVVRAMESLAKELGVKFQTNANIEKIIVENKTAVAIQVNGERIDSDLVLSGADYHLKLYWSRHRAYTEKYWDSRVLPSSLLFYVGFNKIDNISHHALFSM
jgi:phytoene desaturase